MPTRRSERRPSRAISNLLAAGGSDYPMALLQRAGIDLAEPSTVGAVGTLLDTLVDQLEEALGARGLL